MRMSKQFENRLFRSIGSASPRPQGLVELKSDRKVEEVSRSVGHPAMKPW